MELEPFIHIQASINGGTYFNIYQGTSLYAYNWINASNYFPNIGEYTL